VEAQIEEKRKRGRVIVMKEISSGEPSQGVDER
jgi:hypothetical protein